MNVFFFVYVLKKKLKIKLKHWEGVKAYEPPVLEHNFLVLCMPVHWLIERVCWSVALVDMGLLHLLVVTVTTKGEKYKKKRKTKINGFYTFIEIVFIKLKIISISHSNLLRFIVASVYFVQWNDFHFPFSTFALHSNIIHLLRTSVTKTIHNCVDNLMIL